MSVHSNHYESEEEYLMDLRSEYAREQYDMYHYDDDEPEEHPTCEDCKHCRMGLGWSHSVCDIYGKPLEEDKTYGRYGVTIHVERKPRGRIFLCDLNEKELKQIDQYDDACEDFEWKE